MLNLKELHKIDGIQIAPDGHKAIFSIGRAQHGFTLTVESNGQGKIEIFNSDCGSYDGYECIHKPMPSIHSVVSHIAALRTLASA